MDVRGHGIDSFCRHFACYVAPKNQDGVATKRLEGREYAGVVAECHGFLVVWHDYGRGWGKVVERVVVVPIELKESRLSVAVDVVKQKRVAVEI